MDAMIDLVELEDTLGCGISLLDFSLVIFFPEEVALQSVELFADFLDFSCLIARRL